MWTGCHSSSMFVTVVQRHPTNIAKVFAQEIQFCSMAAIVSKQVIIPTHL
jgi:hypothetical protein